MMKPRSALTALLLATAVPILWVIAVGAQTEVAYFSIGTFITMSLFQAGVLAGVGLTAVGTFYSRTLLTVVGAAFLFAMSIPLLVDGLFVFTLLPATISLVLLSVKPTKSNLKIQANFGPKLPLRVRKPKNSAQVPSCTTLLDFPKTHQNRRRLSIAYDSL